MLVFVLPGGRRSVYPPIGGATISAPRKPARKRDAGAHAARPARGRAGRWACGVAVIASGIAARARRPAARPSAADRVQVRGLHAPSPGVLMSRPYGGSAVRVRHM
ncbi:hypothetical protein E1298_08370 [Actinomadura rubrisoli]|uniref:Uncharacterized protein n=1 Tax=Actinomadura rubrisoli TaxID=2530368 RepID=A0A4R5C2E4_9ACTN|nr:hypothetical protein E1298_08370 [Actinomadura rubrisoli]